MRKINQDTVNAFITGDNVKLSNTVINNGSVFLHGNEIIKTIDRDTIAINFCGWTTPTTASRINAVVNAFTNDGASVGIKKGEPEYRPRNGVNHSLNNNEWLVINKYYGI